MNLQEATIKALRGKLLMEDISEINTNEIFNNVKEIIKSNFNIEDGEISKDVMVIICQLLMTDILV